MKITDKISNYYNNFILLFKSFIDGETTVDQITNQIRMLNILEKDFGHKKSYITKKALDKDNKPLPWFTFSAIEFIQSLDLSNIDVLEYGSGIGSAYWAKKSKSITSIESDPEWFKKVNKKTTKNQKILLMKTKSDYVDAIKKQKKSFGMVIVDGIHRYDCTKAVISVVKPDTVIVLDNAEWYPKTTEMLRKNGYKQIDFCGFGPVVYFSWKTSFFMKNLNIFSYKKQNYEPVGCYSQSIDPE